MQKEAKTNKNMKQKNGINRIKTILFTAFTAAACALLAWLILSAPLVSETEKFYSKQPIDFVYDAYHQPAVLINKIYSSGDVDLNITLANPSSEETLFAIFIYSSQPGNDYNRQYYFNLSGKGNLTGKDRFEKNFLATPLHSKLAGEYDLKISILKMKDKNPSKIQQQVYQKSFNVQASPLGFLGFHAPWKSQFPFFPISLIISFSALVATGFFLRNKISKFFKEHSALFVFCFFTTITAFFIYAYLQHASTVHTPIGATDAAQHTLRANNIIQKATGGEVFNYNDFFEQEKKYTPAMHYFFAFSSLLLGTQPLITTAILVPLILFLLIPLAIFLITRRMTENDLAAFLAAATFVFACKTIPWMMALGTWAEAINISLLLTGILLLLEFESKNKAKYLAAGTTTVLTAGLIHPSGMLSSAAVLGTFAFLYLAKTIKQQNFKLNPLKIAAATAIAIIAIAITTAIKEYAIGKGIESIIIQRFLTFDGNFTNPLEVLSQDHWNDKAILAAAILGIFATAKKRFTKTPWQFMLILSILSFIAVELAASVGITDEVNGFNRIFHYLGLFLSPFAGAGLLWIATKISNAASNLVKTKKEEIHAMVFCTAMLAILSYLFVYSPMANYKGYGEYSTQDAYNEFTSVREDPQIWPRYVANQLAFENIQEFEKRNITLILTRSDPLRSPTSSPVDAYCVELSLATNGMDCYNLCTPKGCPDNQLESLLQTAIKEHPLEKKALITKIRTTNYPLISKKEIQGANYYLYEIT